jgi:uncharacterized FlgJ-related protein
VAQRKQSFFRMALPMVARENDRVRTARKLLAGQLGAAP